MHHINIIISKTDTIVGKVIRTITKSEWNHISVVLDGDYEHIYSYTRKYVYLMFPAYLHFEPIKRLSKIAIAEIPISDEDFIKLKNYLSNLTQKIRFYNYPQLILIKWNKELKIDGMHICSSFAAEVLSFTDEITLEKDILLYTPMDIYELVSKYIKFIGTPIQLENQFI